MIMEQLIIPLVETVWKEEQIPEEWNIGHITSLWKGKGDKELLKNHRGITVSSSIGSVVEELIDNRIQQIVPFTQAQGGGKKGSSTFDHLFILRALISISLKEKRETYLTFYDVQKAYDNVDNEDLLDVMWKQGLRGKTWRLLKRLNQNLKASVKTRYGMTKQIDMEIGGRQGSRLTGRMFAKLMDVLAEEVIEDNVGMKITEELIIGILLWIDDVVTSVEGSENQEEMLKRMDRFAKDHKLKWGLDKCRVMKIGKGANLRQWKLGENEIKCSDSYTYLGDIITPDGKNTKNLSSRKNKITASSISINTIASGETLQRIETSVLLELHEKVNIPGLINNAESWSLLKSEQKDLERSEIQCLKSMFDLPIRTPTPGIIFTLGTLYTNIRVDKKRLIYVHKLLRRESSQWTKMMLEQLKNLNIGWYKSIIETLTHYQLPTDFNQIQSCNLNEWKRKVQSATEKENKDRLLQDCRTEKDGDTILKSKTAMIVEKIEKTSYKREPLKELSFLTKLETKTLIIARFRMLECGKNYKGTMNAICDICNCTDDEEHRLNDCLKYRDTNYYDCPDKIAFKTIFSECSEEVSGISVRIRRVWNTTKGQGTMRTE